jgi:predicted membrane-bound mannosyltransferase
MQQSLDENIASLPTNSEKKYKIIGFLIILFTLLIRLYNLGGRVIHHDESVHTSTSIPFNIH